MAEVCFHLCNKCYTYDRDECKCTERKMNLETLKALVLDTKRADRSILIWMEGAIFHGDTFYCTLKKQHFDLHCGIHRAETLLGDKPLIGECYPDKPNMSVMDTITVKWREELTKLDLPFNALSVFLFLLVHYKVQDVIRIEVSDEVCKFDCQYFEIYIRSES